MSPHNVLILPGWQNSGPDHWQSRWERSHGYARVEQHDWQRPLRGDWIARLEDVLLGNHDHPTEPAEPAKPVVLVAHSLGCMLVAAWAAHSRHTHRVKAALLVAPPDVERDDIRQMLHSWAPVPMGKLPFSTEVFASNDDPFCSLSRAQAFATSWGAQLHTVDAGGHLNSASGLGDWPVAHRVLKALTQ